MKPARLTTLVLLVLALAAGCRDRADAPPASPAVRADGEAFLETGDLAAIVRRGQLRFLMLRQDEALLPRAGDPPHREVELAMGFCRSLDIEPAAVFVETTADLVPSLLAGKGDLIASYLSPTPALRQQLAFSSTIMRARDVIVARAGATPLASASALRGRLLAAPQDSILWPAAQSLGQRVPGLRLLPLPGDVATDAAFDAVAAGRADFLLADSVSLDLVRQYRTDVRAVLDLGVERPLAWAARPDNPDLLRALNAFLAREPDIAYSASIYRDDWPGILKRKTLRLITVNSAATYFLWKGDLAGFEYEMAKRFADYHGLRLEVVVAPDYDALTPMLLAGRGDFIAAFLTITDERRARGVAFSRPTHAATATVVARRGRPPLRDAASLAGRTVTVPRGSYPWSLLGELQRRGIDVRRQPAAPGLQPEDLLEQVDAGACDLTLVDDHMLALSLGWLDNIEAALALGPALPEGWAVRAGDGALLKAIDAFWAREYRGAFYNIAYARYFKHPDRVRQAVREYAQAYPDGSFSPYDPLVQRFASLYGFDWRLIVAQMFQESRFRTDLVSPMGAQGLMQVMPRTARELGFGNLTHPPSGIHAGVKYLHGVHGRFDDGPDAANRLLFALAAYNAGPGHVRDARLLARRIGKNPDLWFDHVEQALRLLARPEYARQAKCGYVRAQEPIQYVRQIADRYRIYQSLTPPAPPTPLAGTRFTSMPTTSRGPSPEPPRRPAR